MTTCAINDMAAVAMAGIAFQHNRLVGTLEQRLIIWDTASVNTDGDIYQNMNNVNRALSISGIYQYFKGNNWYDGEIYYTPNYTGELTEEIQARNAEISRRVNAAWDTLRSNYFAHPE